MELGGIVLIVVMVLVVLSLVAGIVLMARGGEANRKYGNKMMVIRVALQGLALLVLGVLFMMK